MAKLGNLRSVVFHGVLAAGTAVCAVSAASSHALADVGVTAAVNTDARGKQPGAAQRVLTLGQSVIYNEEISTDGRGLVQILLLDGTTFTVGPNSLITIDEFVYNPDTGDAKVVASVAKGAFRFIGGQTSKKPGGATIKTPVGTIGIRGAMVEGNVANGSTLFSMIFGNEVRFTGTDGSHVRIYQAGYTLTVTGSGGKLDTNVRPRTQNDAATFQAGLSGKSGQSGGATVTPTNETVATSQVVAVNSGASQNIPLPTPRPNPVQSTPIDKVEQNVAQIDVITQEDINTEIAKEEEPEPPPPVGGSGFARVLAAGDSYTFYGETIPEPGIVGLVGGSAETNRTIALTKADGRLVSNDGSINLPDITGTEGDTGLTAIDVTDATVSGVNYSGTSYAGVGDFATYLLGANGNPQQPFYAIYGTPTDFAALAALETGEDIREYSLTRDSLDTSTPVPFFAQDIYGQVANYSSTNMLAVEPSSSSSDVRVMQAWLDIQGTGTNQKSAAFLFAGTAATDAEGVFKLEGSRRGSFRGNAVMPVANMRGGIGTIAGASGAHFYGPNANHFVVGPPANPPDAFTDTFAGPVLTGDPIGYSGTGIFGSYHVGSLVSEMPQDDFSRTSRNVMGFMSGLGEWDVEGAAHPYILTSTTGVANMYLILDASQNQVFAGGVAFDEFHQSPVVAAQLVIFGSGADGGGGSAFIDDARFGALYNSNPENTMLTTDGGQNLTNKVGDNPGSYLISGRATPIEGYEHCSSCDFVDWGWWGTRIKVGPSGSEVPEERADYVHMGTWVAGDITNPADLPTNLSATYNGTALGTVARTTGESVAKYIATGDMHMSFDFNSRTGNMAISNFDGMNVSGAVSEKSIGAQALFGGGLSGAGLTGAVNGAFVNNGPNVAAGVIGDFGFTGSGVNAVGTIAGKK